MDFQYIMLEQPACHWGNCTAVSGTGPHASIDTHGLKRAQQGYLGQSLGCIHFVKCELVGHLWCGHFYVSVILQLKVYTPALPSQKRKCHRRPGRKEVCVFIILNADSRNIEKKYWYWVSMNPTQKKENMNKNERQIKKLCNVIAKCGIFVICQKNC